MSSRRAIPVPPVPFAIPATLEILYLYDAQPVMRSSRLIKSIPARTRLHTLCIEGHHLEPAFLPPDCAPSLAPSLTNLIIHDDVFRPSFLPFIQELYQLTQLTVLSKSSRFGLPGAPSWDTYGNNLELKWPSDTSLSSFSFPSTLKRTWMNVAIPSNVMRTLPRNLEFLYSCIPSLHALVEARTLVPNALIGSLITVAITGAESLQLLIDRAPFTDLQHLSSSLLSALTSKTWF